MNIIFLTLLNINDINEHNIYCDLIRALANDNHNIYVISPSERRYKQKTHLTTIKNIRLLKIKTGNIQKTNIIEKGISIVLLEGQILHGIKKYFKGIKFDIVLYSTPPINLIKPIKFIKNRYNAKSYLLLKDIFPQNAVDLNMFKENGIIYKLFRKRERELYLISDKIGCMSEANINFLLKHNHYINKNKVEIFPNCIDPKFIKLSKNEITKIRNEYNLPIDRKIIICGGNLGEPQAIPFLLNCIKSQSNNNKIFFFIVGDGTKYNYLNAQIINNNLSNVKLIKTIAQEKFSEICAACDIGLITLDYRFTIPNYPSRLLTYLEAGLPILICANEKTDIGKDIEERECGYWCKNEDTTEFSECLNKILNSDKKIIQKNCTASLINNYSIQKHYKKIYLK